MLDIDEGCQNLRLYLQQQSSYATLAGSFVIPDIAGTCVRTPYISSFHHTGQFTYAEIRYAEVDEGTVHAMTGTLTAEPIDVCRTI